jgi:hypothetical protein
MNIGSLIPPANPAKLTYPKRSEVAVAGSEINKDAPERSQEELYDKVSQHKERNRKERGKRRGQDRRKKDIKPALDMRASSDRRESNKRPRINISV